MFEKHGGMSQSKKPLGSIKVTGLGGSQPRTLGAWLDGHCRRAMGKGQMCDQGPVAVLVACISFWGAACCWLVLCQLCSHRAAGSAMCTCQQQAGPCCRRAAAPMACTCIMSQHLHLCGLLMPALSQPLSGPSRPPTCMPSTCPPARPATCPPTHTQFAHAPHAHPTSCTPNHTCRKSPSFPPKHECRELGEKILGRQVEIYWPFEEGGGKWFRGKVTSFDARKCNHRVE